MSDLTSGDLEFQHPDDEFEEIDGMEHLQISSPKPQDTSSNSRAPSECGNCGAAKTAGTCIIAEAADCNTVFFYVDPTFSYGIDGNGCKSVKVTCQGVEYVYGATYLADGVTPAKGPSGDHNGATGELITFSETYTCAADGTWAPSNGEFSCETYTVPPKTTAATTTTNTVSTKVTATTVPAKTTVTTTKKTTTKTTTKTTKKPTTKTTKKPTTKTTKKPTTKTTKKTTTKPTTKPPTCCSATGTWTEWVSQGQCPDYCGSCGKLTHTRTCTSKAKGCPCKGAAQKVEYCNTGVCSFPRKTCCPGMKTGVWNNENACGPLPTRTVEQPSFNNCTEGCCPLKGIWSDWIDVGNIQPGGQSRKLVCGMCATQKQTRKCLSLSYGCKCVGSSEQTIALTEIPCVFPNPTCCAPYVKKLNGVKKAYTCQLPTTTPTPAIETTKCCPSNGNGLWNDWGLWGTCTKSCGLCGTQTRKRTCASGSYGCPCRGAATQAQSAVIRVVHLELHAVLDHRHQWLMMGQSFAKKANTASKSCKGIWRSWFDVSTCTKSCGMCGVKKQKRYCLPPGCQCSGSFTRQVKCGSVVCPNGISCCAGYSKKMNAITKQYTCQPV
ncbi:unnamed protein product, partial [Mesorhabditis belari]|uniref:Uncharacterized protein n=1 Tax=Mesorhabditis belari TaxID=2138241 RepID=A0AAF3FV57_9BILA